MENKELLAIVRESSSFDDLKARIESSIGDFDKLVEHITARHKAGNIEPITVGGKEYRILFKEWGAGEGVLICTTTQELVTTLRGYGMWHCDKNPRSRSNAYFLEVSNTIDIKEHLANR